MSEHAIIGERVHYIVGIICGHLKSQRFAELFSLQLGVTANNLAALDFRGKLPGRMANDKGVKVTHVDGSQPPVKSSKELFGGNWGYNLFKYKACDYCDDVVAETADIAIGDAWLPGVMNDYQGSNVVVVRNAKLHAIIQQGIKERTLQLKSIAPGTVVQSQAGGIRHRNEGLALRLHDSIKAGNWVPPKRVEPSVRMAPLRKQIYRTRVALRDASHEHFKVCQTPDDVVAFKQALAPLIQQLEHRPLWRRVLSPVKQRLLQLIKR